MTSAELAVAGCLPFPAIFSDLSGFVEQLVIVYAMGEDALLIRFHGPPSQDLVVGRKHKIHLVDHGADYPQKETFPPRRMMVLHVEVVAVADDGRSVLLGIRDVS